jgi:hypothetical protein
MASYLRREYEERTLEASAFGKCQKKKLKRTNISVLAWRENFIYLINV